MTKKTVNDSEVISIQFCGLNYVKKVSQISLFLFVCLFFRHDSDCSKVFFFLSFPIWLYKVQERILSCFIIIVIFSLDHAKNPLLPAPPPRPPGITLDGKSPGVGTLELSNPPGWGQKQRANAPSVYGFRKLSALKLIERCKVVTMKGCSSNNINGNLIHRPKNVESCR